MKMFRRIVGQMVVLTGTCLTLSHGQAIPPIPSALLSTSGSSFFTASNSWGSPTLTMSSTTGVTTSGSSISYFNMKFSGSVPADYYAAVYNKGIPMKANREYTLSMLIYYVFSNSTSELDLGVRTKNGTVNIYSSTGAPTTTLINDYNGDGILRQDVNGVMGYSGTVAGSGTAAWMRWTSTFVSCPFSGTGYLQIAARFRGTLSGTPLNNPPTLCIADARLIESAPVPYPTPNPAPTPIPDDPRVTFSGSAGKFQTDMHIWYGPARSGTNNSVIKVGTSGCMFAIDTLNNFISVRHDITTEAYRANVYFPANTLQGLDVVTGGTLSPGTVCVLSNTNVTIGIQGDSLLMIAPNKDMDFKVRGRIGGYWNRFFDGHLYSVDKDGGFCVNPVIPLATGSTCQYVPVTMPSPNFLDKHNNTTFTGSTNTNWEIKYKLKYGERLGVGTFPPRAYNWERSFDSNYALVQYSETATETTISNQMQTLKNKGVSIVALFESFYKGAWAGGGECGLQYQVKSETRLKYYLAQARAKGLKPVIYMSPRFYYSENMDDFMTEVRRMKTTYTDLDGVYYDGTPFDWVASYDVMRRTRAEFPEGTIILHASMSAPCFMPDILSPFIDTYADITLRGETVPGPRDVQDLSTGEYTYDSINWQFPKWAVSQYNIANCVGVIKGSQWRLRIPETNTHFSGTNPMFGKEDLPQFLKCLEYGGRGRYLDSDDFTKIYNPILRKIEDIPLEYAPIFVGEEIKSIKDAWDANETVIHDPKFFENAYQQRVRDLTEEFLKDIP